MKVLGFTVATTAAVLLAAVSGPSCSGLGVADCGTPSLIETGVDGGPDPCHCAPPPSLGFAACPCGSGSQYDIDLFTTCMALYRLELDAGAEGG
jgi:hypothetical protein